MFTQIPDEEMDERVAGEDPVGHICLYFPGSEIHCDLHGDPTEFESFAKGVGEFVTMIMLQSLMENDSCRH